MKPIQVLSWCRETFHYYIVFTTSIFFILGLVFSFKLVEKTFLNILIARLDDAWGQENYDFRRDVIVVNLHEGATAVLVPLFVYIADVHTGRFKMLVFATTVCIIGLVLNSRAGGDNGQLDLRLFYPALGLLSLGQAAQTVNLEAFLDDQLTPVGLEEDRTRRRTRFWWILVSFVAAILALFGPLPELDFMHLAVVLTFVLGVSFIVFLLGTKHYNVVPTIRNPFKDVGIVIFGAIANRNVECPRTREPCISWLRWLDKAAEEGGCSDEQVMGVKLFLKMLPLWSCFLTLSLVSASGTTFFFAEAISLTDGDDGLNAVLLLSNLSRFTELAASETSTYVIKKLNERSSKYNRQKMELVRIGMGAACCLLCCVAAANRQQHSAASVYWLTPQYLLLGLMMGLSEDGLALFYESQVSESLSRYGEAFVEHVMGVGKFMSIVCVVVFSMRPFGWFQRVLEYSSLDRYYVFLAVLSAVNVVVYGWVGRWYGDNAFLVEDDEEMGRVDQVGLACSYIEGKHAPAQRS